MKNKFLLFISVVFFVPSTWALESLVKPLPKTILLNQIANVEPTNDHHINVNAPHSCGAGKTVNLSARGMKCQFSKPGDEKISMGVCDNSESFCKIEQLSVTIASEASSEKNQDEKFEIHASENNHEEGVEGFFTNEIDGAIKKAKDENKLLLIDFYGTWCPPCRELDEYVFVDPQFMDAAQNFIKLRVDSDLKVSWPWMERYKIQGYPTLVVVEPKSLDEIGRIVGFHPTSTIVKWMGVQENLKGNSIQWAMKQNTEESKVRVAKWYLNRGEEDKAIEVLKSSKSTEANLVRNLALKEVSWRKADNHTYQQTLIELIEKNPEDIRVGKWVDELLEFDLNSGKPFVSQALASLESWRKNDKFSEQTDIDFDSGDLYEIEAEIQNKLGDKEKEKQAYLGAAKYLENLVKHSNLKLGQGSNLRRAYDLQQAGLTKDAEKIYKKLAQAYGDQFVFNFRYARLLYELKQYKKALPYAEKAEKQGYGDNWLRLILLKSKILVSLNKTEEAKNLIHSTLAQTVLPENSAIRTHKNVQNLQDELATLEKQ